ncbi:PAS domain S-box protein [Niabella yanshanensis]|uniref:histidine kinase n=1 Tax=Niabella yanshanensis TaxID=577386 RepID=A0ABZ0WDL0_9BACT|nr:PAS domain S-box protein [Niabella yanshanensis]WQD40772.1 PAS domain S-box protein [Niabella yanshanensis]
MITKTLHGIIASWYGAAERMFGYTSDEAVGRPITMLIPRERLAEESMILDQIHRGLKIEHFETVRSNKDGELIPVSLSISPIRNHLGEISPRRRLRRQYGFLLLFHHCKIFKGK